MLGWHAKNYANKVGIMHESKGQCIGKAPSLHLFHTTVRPHPATESAPIHAVINAMHKFLSFTH